MNLKSKKVEEKSFLLRSDLWQRLGILAQHYFVIASNADYNAIDFKSYFSTIVLYWRLENRQLSFCRRDQYLQRLLSRALMKKIYNKSLVSRNTCESVALKTFGRATIA